MLIINGLAKHGHTQRGRRKLSSALSSAPTCDVLLVEAAIGGAP